MEKQIAIAAYWIGILSSLVALVMRGFALMGMFTFSPRIGGNPISYRTFLEGAVLLFAIAIASSAIVWLKDRKA